MVIATRLVPLLTAKIPYCITAYNVSEVSLNINLTYTLSEVAKLVWRVFFNRKPFPALLISTGVTLLFAGASQQWLASWETLRPVLDKYLSPEAAEIAITLSNFFYPQDSTPQTIMLALGTTAFCVGIITGIINFYFEKKAITKSTVLPIELYGFARAIPSKELYKELEREGYNTSIRYKVNLSSLLDKPFVSKEDVSQSVQLLERLIYSIDLHRADNEQLSINLTSIAQVPLVFQLGYFLGMMTRVDVWSWDRFNQRWDNGGKTFDMIRTLEFNTGSTISCPPVVYEPLENTQGNCEEVGIAFSFTNNVDLQLCLKDSGVTKLYNLHFDSQNNMSPSNLLSKSRRSEVLRTFNQLYEREIKNSGYQKLHLFVSAPTSFVFELGQMLSQNHFLPCVIYQYGDVRSVGYSYHSFNITFSGTNSPNINILKTHNKNVPKAS